MSRKVLNGFRIVMQARLPVSIGKNIRFEGQAGNVIGNSDAKELYPIRNQRTASPFLLKGGDNDWLSASNPCKLAPCVLLQPDLLTVMARALSYTLPFIHFIVGGPIALLIPPDVALRTRFSHNALVLGAAPRFGT